MSFWLGYLELSIVGTIYRKKLLAKSTPIISKGTPMFRPFETILAVLIPQGETKLQLMELSISLRCIFNFFDTIFSTKKKTAKQPITKKCNKKTRFNIKVKICSICDSPVNGLLKSVEEDVGPDM